MDSTQTPPRRQSDRRSTPRHHNPDEGYGSPPDGSGLAGEFALARRPVSWRRSWRRWWYARAGGWISSQQSGQRAGGKAKQKPNDEGSTRLCWTPAEKVVLWKAFQKQNPFAESGQKLMRKHWRRVAAYVIEDQDVEVYTNEGGRETPRVLHSCYPCGSYGKG
ncbi:unnamed protein product [Ectocarpus sp. CCAP 1310/34]|nr:unnamed protein product [Ectocarpus sp. CCAP 1310/34]